ncbi:MobV family relaxase [uncultured Prevotella sp.]|uniref:MobV family relaxase n=1 Tax=uncultured Prevotella sp. TaxID=159272 RepID=UPI002607AA4B|nr:MobV family relaxase [uncultured Prevotella sp.]
MSDNKKQMMDIQKVKSFSVAVSDEHQRNWGDDLFSRKENDPKYNYDRSRTRLNFQVSKGGELGPIDKNKSITDKIEQAIKNRVTGRVNTTSNRAVSIVFGGNREQMRKLAFGDQTISENGNNWDVDSCSGIDRWATDIYDFCCREFGEENVVSFIVHLDELNPHVHAVIVPITKDGRLSAKDMFGGNDMNQARTRMRELHSRLAEVNEKYGLERGDDITITGAKHKSTETYRRELADECRTLSNEVGMKKTLLSGLNRSITKAETKIKALQTMVSNLEKAEAEKQATIAELEDYMKNHLGDAVEIKAKITATRKELWDVRDKLNDKKMKLEQAKLQLNELQKNTSHIEARNRDIKADFEKTVVSYQQQMINKIWAQAGMKALSEIANIYPRMTSIHDSSLFDDSFAMDFINYGDKIIYCAMYLYVGYVNEATNFAESQGGGGSDAKDWGREKDEDEIEWIRRCLRQATRMVKPRKGKGLSR